MEVYDRVPSVVRRGALANISGQQPAALRRVVIVLGVGLVLCVGALAPFGLVWLTMGVGVCIWALVMLRGLAPWAVARPSLVFSIHTNFGGVRRGAWEIYATDPAAVAAVLTRGLSDRLGPPTVVSIAPDGTTTEIDLADALAPQPTSAMVAFALRGPPDVDVGGDAEGVWVRLDGEERSTVTVLANEGPATTALVEVAAGLG